MSLLSEVKSWMRWWGWTNDGGPGAVKRAYDGNVIARFGDAIWEKDVDEAIAIEERMKAREQAAYR